MLLAGEMLIMLIMLNHIWDSWGNPEFNLTLSTFPIPEAFFASHKGNVNNVSDVNPMGLFPKSPHLGFNIINISCERGIFQQQGFNIINIINISPARSMFCFPQGKC